jgi:hypothetical protein
VPPDGWITASDFAALAGISERKARLGLHRIVSGKTRSWRGAALVVRTVPGRGGRSGLRYEVRVDSLPAELQVAWRERNARNLGAAVLRSDDAANRDRDFWATVLGPALAHPRHSRERGQAIKEIAARLHLFPGHPHAKPLSERTIRRQIAAFDACGLAGLQKRARADRGRKRVTISMRWDKAVTFDDATRQRIAARLRDKVRSLCRSGYMLSKVRYYAFIELSKLTREAGFDGGERELRRICQIPREMVAAERHLAKVARFERDRKAHEDAKPRVRRTAAGLLPMQVVVGDVHPMDILVSRDDGSTAHARMVGWMDVATRRVFLSLFLLDRGRGIINAHVIRSFIAMVAEWGLPRLLYLDHGAEYNFVDFISDALKLAGSGLEIYDRRSGTIRAKPYNAAAKPIEWFFGLFERLYLSEVPGWIGGDRMKSKTANVGLPPAPFPYAFEQLGPLVEAHRTIYHNQPQKGLGGRSPAEAFAAAVAGGWQRTDIDPLALRVAFSTSETRRVTQGRVSVNGRLWTCPELHSYLGDKVTVLIPKYEDWSFLPLKDEAGRWLGNAVEDRAYAFLDPEGAREAQRRDRRYKGAIRAAGRAVKPVDRIGEVFAAAALMPSTPAVPSAGLVSISEDHAAIGRTFVEDGAARERRRLDDVDREQRARLALIEKRRRASGR